MQVDWVNMKVYSYKSTSMHAVHIYTLSMQGILQLAAYSPRKWLNLEAIFLTK